MSTWHLRHVTEHDIERIDGTLREWEPLGSCGAWLQAGDIGWMLRFARENTALALLEWTTPGGEPGAIMCRDAKDSWRFATNPGLFNDRTLAESIVDWAMSRPPNDALTVDGPWVPAVWRQVFVERGFEASTDTWVQMWRPLDTGDIVDVPSVEAIRDDRSIADRVVVQKAAFSNSTFTVDKWHNMAEGPSFRREFDMLARDAAENPVAAVTVWLPGAGKCGLIEPMGTHSGYRRQGHGQRVILAACTALARAGASGVSVVPPGSNPAAVEVYRSAGFRRIGLISGMIKQSLNVR